MITVIRGDDWHGVYNDDGDLIAEGHSLSYEDIAKAAGIPIEVKTPDQDWLEAQSRLPKILWDVKLEKR